MTKILNGHGPPSAFTLANNEIKLAHVDDCDTGHLAASTTGTNNYYPGI